ncbi:MAG: UDP-glucose dehydrogenase family protein [Pyrinomonadaceae bacterium]|jgi:UDPglucose 6-dehydrogenase
MQIAVIGTGYVGLVTGACFAEFGTSVTCVDVDADKIARLNNGQIPIYEPGLDQIVSKNKAAGRLNFTTDVRAAVEQSLVIILAVGTPPKDDGSADLSFIEAAALDVARHMNGYKVIVTKSTVPVGTGERLRRLIREQQQKFDFGIVSNPEFLREGAAIDDFMRPDRVVIGSRDEAAVAIMRDLYRPLYLIETPVVITSLEAAELTKYAANAFLATKISFINEVANLCDRIGCDVHDVARAMGMDNRIGRYFLHPGPGYGGSCFPKDTTALLSVAKEYGGESLIVGAAVEVNDAQRLRMVEKIERLMGGDVSGKQVAVLGLSFKPETDDMREAPSVDIIRALMERGARVRAYDPVAVEQAKKVLTDVEYASDEYEAASGADVLLFMTEWNQFRALDMQKIKGLMRAPRIADLRNIYEPQRMRELGFDYVGVGR